MDTAQWCIYGPLNGSAWGQGAPLRADGSCEPTPKLVFVTRQIFTANLGGVAGADAKCQTAAEDAGISGTFKAWIADGTSSPSTTFTRCQSPYELVDETLVADNWEDLTDGTIKHPINKDEYGTELTLAPTSVWTNTVAAGTPARTTLDTTCRAWGALDPPYATDHADTGSYGASTAAWTHTGGWLYCSIHLHLYCFEQ